MANMLSPLATPAATRDVLEEHGLSTKHALGQNFLVNDAILQKIVELGQLDASDDVLEVGPGIGTLTIALLKCAGRVVSVERDADLPAVLEDTLEPWADRFAPIPKDALELTEEEVQLALAKCAVSKESALLGLGMVLAALSPTSSWPTCPMRWQRRSCSTSSRNFPSSRARR